MKKKKLNQQTEYVRESNEEILEAMRQAMQDPEDNSGVIEILLKLMTFTPEKDVAMKAFTEIMVLNHNG